MSENILILGASYGSLLGTKLLMAGHNVTLICRSDTAKLINMEGTEVRIKLKGEETHRAIFSRDLPGKLDAQVPEDVEAGAYDLVGLAMQEPQYTAHALRTLLVRIAEERVPCLSIMNMPPIPFLKRISGLDTTRLETSFTDARIWDRFDPDLVTLCSPDPQAYRLRDETPNKLLVGLPTNFRAAAFGTWEANELLNRLAAEISDVRLDGKDVPVKLRVFESLFIPLSKWSMLLTGNYRCITPGNAIAINEAVHGNLALSREIYEYVETLVRRLGADPADQVPFEKYAAAAENLLKPSSNARAVESGAPIVERVDMLIQLIGRTLGMTNSNINQIVTTVDRKMAQNQRWSA